MSATSTPSITLDEAFTNARISPLSLMVVFLCILATATEGYDFQSMSFAAPLLARAWFLRPSQIGALLTASVAGVVVGSLLLAPNGDRFGRRPCALAGLLIAGAFTAAGALAPSMGPLLATRALAGLGIGLATPNINVIAMETSVVRWRAMAIVAVSCGYPLGAALGAAIAGGLVLDYGYKAIFLLGAAATTAVLFLLVLGLPESPYILIKNSNKANQLRRLISSLTRRHPDQEVYILPEYPRPQSKVAALLVSERRLTTLLLWLLNFSGFVMLYFFLSWLPSLLAHRGMSAASAIRTVALFNFGGVAGAIFLAAALRRLAATSVLGLAYLIAAAAIVALGVLSRTDATFVAAVAIAGAAIIGSQFCLTAVVNQYYPADIRVSASGYAAGMGRLGAVLAPLVGAIVVSMAKSTEQIFLITAIPSLVALLATAWLRSTKGLERAV